MNYKKVAYSARFLWKMCNFTEQLKHVASKEKLVDIQWDNIIARAFLKLSKKARYKLNRQSAYFQVFALSLTFEKTFEK